MSFKKKKKNQNYKSTKSSFIILLEKRKGDNTNVDIFLNFELQKVVKQTTINNQPIIIK